MVHMHTKHQKVYYFDKVAITWLILSALVRNIQLSKPKYKVYHTNFDLTFARDPLWSMHYSGITQSQRTWQQEKADMLHCTFSDEV